MSASKPEKTFFYAFATHPAGYAMCDETGEWPRADWRIPTMYWLRIAEQTAGVQRVILETDDTVLVLVHMDWDAFCAKRKELREGKTP